MQKKCHLKKKKQMKIICSLRLLFNITAPICLICLKVTDLSGSWVHKDGFQVQTEKGKLTMSMFSIKPITWSCDIAVLQRNLPNCNAPAEALLICIHWPVTGTVVALGEGSQLPHPYLTKNVCIIFIPPPPSLTMESGFTTDTCMWHRTVQTLY